MMLNFFSLKKNNPLDYDCTTLYVICSRLYNKGFQARLKKKGKANFPIFSNLGKAAAFIASSKSPPCLTLTLSSSEPQNGSVHVAWLDNCTSILLGKKGKQMPRKFKR